MEMPETATAVRAADRGNTASQRYVLFLLFAAYALSFLDRQIVNILGEAIKVDLRITNVELGLLTGLAFAIFYTVLGIPIAHLASRHSRPLVIAVCMAVWSGFTMLSGRATSFAVMAFARLGVGFGEAGCNPCAHSMLADTVPPERRASALATYSLGLPVGSMLGLAFGGALADAYGWRAAFLLAGAPGLLLAAIIALTVPEPRARSRSENSPPQPTLRETMSEIRTKRSFLFATLAIATLAFVGYGHGAFFAPFFLRVHGSELQALAHRFGLGVQGFLGVAGALTTGLGSLTGTWLGGVLADRAAKRDKRAYMGIPAIAALASLPLILATYLVASAALALSLGFFTNFLNALWYGPVYATAQSVVRSASRAASAAILFFVMNLIGLGLGPVFVGALNDVLARSLGQAEGIRWALLISASAVLLSAALFWQARKWIASEFVE